MPTASPSKYAENQILAATVGSYPLMGEILADTLPRATAATAGVSDFVTVLGDLDAIIGDWNAGETAIANAEAALPAATQLFDAQMTSLTRQPNTETNSILETWDNTIRSQVPFQSATYNYLLPQGRETLTRGTREEQLDAIHNLGTRLAEQTTKPVLVTLAATVTAFYTAAYALRTAQINAKGTLDTARQTQEANRVTAAGVLYALIGQGMVTWRFDPARVDTLWDVNILRNPSQTPPEAPLDTTWDAATRTLSTSALPPGATRIEAWRVGPGSMPELLLTAGPGATSILIPATITFTPGGLYQLWLVALNGRGKSGPGPVQNWTAP